MFFHRKEFNLFVSNLEYYLDLPVEFFEMQYNNDLKHDFPVGIIGDIKLNFNHYTDFECAKACWEKRKKRINMENLLIISSATSVDDALEFDKLPYENKLIFVPQEVGTKSSYCIHFEDHHDGVTIGMVANGTANGTKSMFDILSFLNHESDFLRTQ